MTNATPGGENSQRNEVTSLVKHLTRHLLSMVAFIPWGMQLFLLDYIKNQKSISHKAFSCEVVSKAWALAILANKTNI